MPAVRIVSLVRDQSPEKPNALQTNRASGRRNNVIRKYTRITKPQPDHHVDFPICDSFVFGG
jgi:hypothetical protein